ncbi:MAG: ComF family protein [Dehalococcoidia bacterium]
MTHWALGLLFPAQCVGCGTYGSFLCAPCQGSLPRLEPPFCRLCAEPVRQGDLCRRCTGTPLAIEGIRAPFLMEGAIREAVHRLKYQNLRAIAPVLGELMATYVEANPFPADTLVPVPMHPKRLRQRGYNQSLLLARGVGEHLGLPVAEDALVRKRDTPPQASSSSVEERLKNVEGGFRCQGGALEGKRVVVVDDVCTTGSTLQACAAALKEDGAASVWGLVLAREA